MSPNLAASVHRRLLNYARAQGRPFNEVLVYYGLQRFLYRLSQSRYSEQFILKGALMLLAWQSPETRPTRDIDLLGHVDNTPAVVAGIMREVCEAPANDDGLRFDAASVTAERIIEGASQSGVRVRLDGYLERAQLPVQVDIGFGDPLVPGPTRVSLPTILDLAPAELWGYSRESAIAEKLHAMVSLGEINSRIKDYYDIWLLSRLFEFDGEVFCRAVKATFARREMVMRLPIVGLEETFSTQTHETQWRAFVSRNQLEAPRTLRETIIMIAAFLSPPLRAVAEGQTFTQRWLPGGPWE